MNTKLRLLMHMLCFAALTAAAWSYPTLYGDTGLVLAPTGDVIQPMYVDTAVDLMQIKENGESASIYPIRINYGGGENTEVSLVLAESKSGNSAGVDVLGGGIKFALTKEDMYSKYPGIAIGARLHNFTMDGETLESMQGYLALSKTLLLRGDMVENGFVIRAHAGVAHTRYTDAHEATFTDYFVGASYKTASGNAIVVDYIPEQEDQGVTLRKATVSGAFRRQVSDHFWLELGSTRPFGLGEDTSTFLGFIYQYGERVNRERRKPVLF